MPHSHAEGKPPAPAVAYPDANDRADWNPLEKLKPPERGKLRKECTRERRAATPEEMPALLDATWDRPMQFRASGPERALAYWRSVMTGLRAKEIKSLTVGDFNIGADPATVTIRVQNSKNNHTATLPLPPVRYGSG